MGLQDSLKYAGYKQKTPIEYSNGSAQADVEIASGDSNEQIHIISLEAATSDQSAGSITFSYGSGDTRIGQRFQLPIYHTAVSLDIPKGEPLNITNPVNTDYYIRWKRGN